MQSIKDELSLAEEASAKKEENENRDRQRKIETQRALEREKSRKDFTNAVLRFIAFLVSVPSLLIATAIGEIDIFNEIGMVARIITVIFGVIAYKLGRYAISDNTENG